LGTRYKAERQKRGKSLKCKRATSVEAKSISGTITSDAASACRRNDIMDLDSVSKLGLKIVKQTRKVNVSKFMPAYDGHIGGPPRQLTRVEKRLLPQFPAHQLEDSLPPPSPAAPATPEPRAPWIPACCGTLPTWTPPPNCDT
jgi:hypothetical protein